MSRQQRIETHSFGLIQKAESASLMHVTMEAREPAGVQIAGHSVIDFTNCSYLGLDRDPEMIAAAQRSLSTWGLHYCCARSRLSTGELVELERDLSEHFGAAAITFPSVTTTHMSVMPLIASGTLLDGPADAPVRLVFDRFAHASMQSLKPLLEPLARIVTTGHNDMAALEREIGDAAAAGERCVYVADGVYSMGGTAPVDELLRLSETRGLYLYLDDAHGTSIYGQRGEGYVPMAVRGGPWPPRLFANFSLAKGFGCNGGGVLVPTPEHARRVRYFGQTYAFSGPLDFAMVGAARQGLRYHKDGTVARLQAELRARVQFLDQRLTPGLSLPFSPIRMVRVGAEERVIDVAAQLLHRGFYVSAVFYPVVPRGDAQLRLCVTVRHTEEQIAALCGAIFDVLPPNQSLPETCRPRRSEPSIELPS